MKFKPNFEQFKKDELKLEKIPTVKPEAHFDLNDISKKINDAENITDKEYDLLEILFTELQDLDRDIVNCISKYKSNEVISRQEFLAIVDVFLIAKQVGPDLKKVTDIFLLNNVSNEEFENILHSIQLPEFTKKVISEVYKKIFILNNDLK